MLCFEYIIMRGYFSEFWDDEDFGSGVCESAFGREKLPSTIHLLVMKP